MRNSRGSLYIAKINMKKQSRELYVIVTLHLHGSHAQVKSIIGTCGVEHLFNLFQMSHMEAFTLIAALWSCQCCEKMQLTPHVSMCTPTHTHIFIVHSANTCFKSGSFTAKPQLFFTHTLWFVCLLTDCTCASSRCLTVFLRRERVQIKSDWIN